MMKTKLLLMLLVAFGLVAGTARANLLVNPGFEDGAFTGSNHTPDSWVHWYTSLSPNHTWTSNTAEAHSGSKYMRMNNWTTDTWSSSGWLGQDISGVKEDGDYTFTVWAKNGAEDQTNLAAISCDWQDSLGNWIGSDFVVIPVTSPDWIEVDFGNFTAPEGAASGTVWLVAPVANGLNAICYDDIVMLGPDPNVYAGSDMISWDGAEVSLTGSESLEGGYETIEWTADPAGGAVITGGETLTPTVTINDPIIETGPDATIANHSFENWLNNWVVISGETRGTWSGYGWPSLYITPTDGHMCMWQSGVGDEGILSQVLGNVLAANATYTLTVDVVDDGSWPGDAVEYKIQLLAGGTVLAEDDDSHPLDTYGVWATSTVTFPTGAAPTELGEPLEIRLITKAGSSPVNFDNVHLTASPDFPSYAPDVLTYKLRLDIDGGKYDIMKIDVYSDACAARLAAGLRETTDVVGDDCITNLADLAEIAATWPDHNALTEPMADPTNLGAEAITFDFDDGTMQGWSNYEDTTGEELYVVMESIQYEPAHSGLYMVMEEYRPDRDSDEFVKVLVSPMFQIVPTTFVEIWTLGGVGDVETPAWEYYADLPTVATQEGGFVGAALCRVSDGEYLLFCRRTFVGEDYDSYEAIGWDSDTITAAIAGDSPDERYVVNIIDTHTTYGVEPWWAWIAFDTITIIADFRDPRNPSPANNAYVEPASDLELSWVNVAPDDPADPVWVDVWFGTDPNDYNDFNKIVDAVEDANFVTVDASTLGTYYWRVDWYIYGDPAVEQYNNLDGTDPNGGFPIVKGAIWKFTASTEVPVSVYAGINMITWSGEPIALDPTIYDDGASTMTIAWSAEPDDVVVFDPDEFAEDPTVTIDQWSYSEATILNAGFETPVLPDGLWSAPSVWTSAGGWIQVVNPGPKNSDYAAYDGIAPEGDNVGIAGSSAGEGGLRQVLVETLTADTTYTLTVEVGNTPTYDGFGYKVQLLADGTVLAEDDNSLTIEEDTFETSTVTYVYDPADSDLVGQNLEIRLLALSNGTNIEVNYDVVRLTADPPYLPTGAQTVTLKLWAEDDAGEDEDTMTISVYDNACLAAIGLGEEIDPGDFDADCDTDLTDLAAMAEEWLVYSELEDPVIKP